MKILELGKFYPIRGGVEKVMWDITSGVSSRGVDCDMLCAGSKPQTITLNSHGHVYVVWSLGRIAATMISPSMLIWLRKHRAEYDVIHIHHPDPMACLALYLSGFRGRVILHWHSDIFKQRLLLKLYKPLQNWMINRADVIVGTSPVYVRESEALAEVLQKCVHIPIGVQPVPEDPMGTLRLRERFVRKKIVFSLGRLVGYKGYDYLVDAAKYLGDDYVVVIGGDGPLRDDLKQKIDEANLWHKVRLIGRVPDEDLGAWYHACSVFCLSSIWKTEAFAIVQIEAMSCGKPVVATRIPGSGVPWVNSHGVSGLNVEPCDGRQLAEAIMEITSDPVRYAGYCERARARYGQMFTYERMIDRCIELYEAQ